MIIVGIDPGLVHTGVVEMEFLVQERQLFLRTEVINGLNVAATVSFIQQPDHVFIEAYRPRSNFKNDSQLGEFINLLKAALPKAKSLDNMGVKKVVTPHLMKMLGLWTFDKKTNHQDLRSAARIALFGMLKDDELNPLVTDVLTDILDGRPWALN